MSKNTVDGPLLKKPQEVFEPIQHNWSTLISIEGPKGKTNTGYYGDKEPPLQAQTNPAIVVRTGYAAVRAIFILKENIEEKDWKNVAMEAMSRPECSLGEGGRGDEAFGFKAKSIKRIYKGLTSTSEYPFPALKPAFCLEDMYTNIEFVCGYPGPCQRVKKGVAGSKGALCKPGDIINYSICAAMPCNCSESREQHDLIRDLERLVPTRHQMMLMAKFDQEEKQIINTEKIKKIQRSAAAKKGWETRRRNAVAKVAERIDNDIKVPDLST